MYLEMSESIARFNILLIDDSIKTYLERFRARHCPGQLTKVCGTR